MQKLFLSSPKNTKIISRLSNSGCQAVVCRHWWPTRSKRLATAALQHRFPSFLGSCYPRYFSNVSLHSSLRPRKNNSPIYFQQPCEKQTYLSWKKKIHSSTTTITTYRICITVGHCTTSKTLESDWTLLSLFPVPQLFSCSLHFITGTLKTHKAMSLKGIQHNLILKP